MYRLAAVHFISDRRSDKQDRRQYDTNSRSYCLVGPRSAKTVLKYESPVLSIACVTSTPLLLPRLWIELDPRRGRNRFRNLRLRLSTALAGAATQQQPQPQRAASRSAQSLTRRANIIVVGLWAVKWADAWYNNDVLYSSWTCVVTGRRRPGGTTDVRWLPGRRGSTPWHSSTRSSSILARFVDGLIWSWFSLRRFVLRRLCLNRWPFGKIT